MELRYKNYIAVPSVMGDRFDLAIEQESQKIGTGTQKEPNGEKYLKRKTLGYDMRLDWIVEHIITMEVKKNEVTYDLEQFLEKFKEVQEDIKKEFNISNKLFKTE
jgi:hypothetical protein